MSNQQQIFETYLQTVFDTLQSQKLQIRTCPVKDLFDFKLSYEPQEENFSVPDPLGDDTFHLDLPNEKSSILSLCQQILTQQKKGPGQIIQQNPNLLKGQEINLDSLDIYVEGKIFDDPQATMTILGEINDLMTKRSRLVDYQQSILLYQSTPQEDSRVRQALTRLEDNIRAKFYTYFNSLKTREERDHVMQWGVIDMPGQNNSFSTSASSSAPLSLPVSSSSVSNTSNVGGKGSSSSSVGLSSNQRPSSTNSMPSSSSSHVRNEGAKGSVRIGKGNSSNTFGNFSIFSLFGKRKTGDETSTTSRKSPASQIVDNPQTLEQLNPALKRVRKEIKQEEEKVERLKLEASQLAKRKRQLSNKPRSLNPGINEYRKREIQKMRTEAGNKLRRKKMSEGTILTLKNEGREYLRRIKRLTENSSVNSQQPR